MNFITKGPITLNDNANILLRFYLASSRSFKNEIANNDSIEQDFKIILLETSMPKFIWVAEVSNQELILDKKANGMILLDATEANIYNNKPLIIAAYEENLILVDENSGTLEKINLLLPEFRIFEHNLNIFES